MPRWIAFDQKTVMKLREQFPREQVFEHGARSVTDFARGGAETMVAILPLEGRQEAAVAVFRRRKAQHVSPRPASLRTQTKERVRPGGVLGLHDEVVFEEEKPRPRQKSAWWRRFWDDEE